MGELLVMVVILLPPAVKKRLVHPLLGWTGLLVALALLLPVDSATAIVVVLLVLVTNAAHPQESHALRRPVLVAAQPPSSRCSLAGSPTTTQPTSIRRSAIERRMRSRQSTSATPLP